jgi:hypothetical protein
VALEKSESLKVGTRATKNPSNTKQQKVPAVGTRISGRKTIPVISPPPPKSIKKESPTAAATSVSPVKRGPGRPRKHPLPESAADDAEAQPPRKRGRPPKSKSPQVNTSPPPRKRGRPRKHPLTEDFESPPSKKRSPSSSATDVVVKRGPGRPSSKSKTPPVESEVVVKRGPGRPPSKPKLQPPPPPEDDVGVKKRGPGRPPKSARKRSKSPAPKKAATDHQREEAVSVAKPTKGRVRAAATGSSGATEAASVWEEMPALPEAVKGPVKVSRSGRTVKRTSFHDEIDEGEQHLKSVRYAEQQRKTVAMSAMSDEEEHAALISAHSVHELDAHHLHFLETMPDVEDMSHLVGLDDHFVIPEVSDHMAANIGVEPTNIFGPPYPVPIMVHNAALIAGYEHELVMKDAQTAASAPIPELAILDAAHSEDSPTFADARSLEEVAAAVYPPGVTTVAAQEPTQATEAALGVYAGTVPPVVESPAPPPAAESTAMALPEAPQTGAIRQADATPVHVTPPAQVPETTLAADDVPAHATSAAPTAMADVVAQGEPTVVATTTVPIPDLVPLGQLKPAPVASLGIDPAVNSQGQQAKVPRRKPGARECMQISRRFGVNTIPEKWMDTLLVRFTP